MCDCQEPKAASTDAQAASTDAQAASTDAQAASPSTMNQRSNSMPKIKTAELTGAALDWAVAKCEGKNITIMRNDDGSLFPQPVWSDGLWQQNYSTSWAQGGPIIERERIDLLGVVRGAGGPWTASIPRKNHVGWRHLAEGPTPLVAGMRCFVASRFGDIVEIPEELTP